MVKSNTLSINLHIWPDIRNPVATRYLAGYPDPNFFSPDYPDSGYEIGIRYNPDFLEQNSVFLRSSVRRTGGYLVSDNLVSNNLIS